MSDQRMRLFGIVVASINVVNTAHFLTGGLRYQHFLLFGWILFGICGSIWTQRELAQSQGQVLVWTPLRILVAAGMALYLCCSLGIMLIAMRFAIMWYLYFYGPQSTAYGVGN